MIALAQFVRLEHFGVPNFYERLKFGEQ